MSESQPTKPRRRTRNPQSDRAMRAGSVGLITIYFVAMTAILLHGLVVLWPPERPDELREELAALRSELEREAARAPSEEPTAGTEDGVEPPVTSEEAPAAGAAPVEAAEQEVAPAETLVTGDGASPAIGSPPESAAEPGRDPCLCDEEQEERVTFFRLLRACLYPEERLFLIVLFAGALGGLLHALRSFYWYLGNRKLVVSWTGFYLTLPFAGALMAFVFYLVIRGGFTQSTGIDDTNPFGFAALAVLVGLFTEQAAQRLKDVAETAFARVKPGADHVSGPTIERIAPTGGAGGKQVAITGAGFVEDDVVLLGGRKAAVVEITDTKIVVEVPEGTVAGEVEIEVVRPGGERATRSFVYQPPPTE